MVRFQGKILQVMRPLSCLWEGLEDVLKASRSFFVGYFFVSFLVSCTRRLKNLEMLMTDPRKAETMLKEKENELKQS